jgi:hypothetical protein
MSSCSKWMSSWGNNSRKNETEMERKREKKGLVGRRGRFQLVCPAAKYHFEAVLKQKVMFPKLFWGGKGVRLIDQMGKFGWTKERDWGKETMQASVSDF